MKKILVYTFAGLVVLVGGAFAFLVLKQPSMAAASTEKVVVTAEKLERGRYLYESVTDCSGCHGDRNWEKFAAPVRDGGVGSGMDFPDTLGFPGHVAAPNITPDVETGIGGWTDGEKKRAIREGVTKDGRALFTFMRYPSYRKMSDEDLDALVVYINSLAPVKRRMPETKLEFPVKYLVKFAPQPVPAGVKAPAATDRLKYGEYLVTIAGCIECHSQLDKGEPVKGLEYGGGHEFPIGKFVVHSANITPDEETGIGKWSEERFVARFKAYSNMTYESAPLATQANFTVMPWLSFAQMKEDDLKAVFAYLKTLKPVRNSVDAHAAPPPAN